ncbi:hypothetical protein BTO06_14105 [Tenacibaculum sp. SZ-18]|nr:hypothetical protein BTO06_14105 [Tenacibaculum sp. SZ-18]
MHNIEYVKNVITKTNSPVNKKQIPRLPIIDLLYNSKNDVSFLINLKNRMKSRTNSHDSFVLGFGFFFDLFCSILLKSPLTTFFISDKISSIIIFLREFNS